MKKRMIAALLLLCAAFSLLAPTASAAEDLFFVAVNDSIPLTLSAEEKPYAAATGLYVSYTVFGATPGGVAASYNAANQTLTLFSTQKRLVFNVNKGTCTDEKDKVSEVLTTYKNGRLYIPISLCAGHCGLSYSVLTSRSGYTVLRFTTGREIYDDATFIDKAENLINYRADSQSAQQPQVNEPQETDDEREDEKSPVCFAVCGAEQMDAALGELKRQSAYAAFFLTAEEMAQNPDLVRRIFVQGHTIGLAVPEDAADAQQALRAANEQLDAILHYKTLLALASPEQIEQIRGYFTYENTERSLTSLLRSQTGRVYVCRERAVQELRAAVEQGGELTLLRENTR